MVGPMEPTPLLVVTQSWDLITTLRQNRASPAAYLSVPAGAPLPERRYLTRSSVQPRPPRVAPAP